MVARHLGVVLIDFSVTVFPVMEFRACYTDPLNNRVSRDIGSLRPLIDVVDNGVADIVGNPFAVQGSPFAFFV